MKEAIKITGIVGAYLTDYRRPEDLAMAMSEGREQYLVGSFLAYAGHDMSGSWTKVGEAEITVTMLPPDEQIASAIKALRGQLDQARAEWLTKQQEILDRISKLQALDYVEA